MEAGTSPRRKPKSPAENSTNIRSCVTCTNVPEGLFDASAAKKHFSKFGKPQKITLLPKKQMCIVEYEQTISAQRAVLNAGAFDGFMFDVTRTKARVRKRSKKDEDPDWLPDSEVEEELSAMSGAPSYRVSRQKAMQIDTQDKIKPIVRVIKQTPIRKPVHKSPLSKKTPASQSVSSDNPVVVTAQTTLSTAEAASELHQLRSRVSLTPDEQWRTLDARDRILRAWGGAGSRVKVGGATIGTCLDMCPEKELLHRQAEHQVMTLETVEESDGQLEPERAVKQYSRSSADQEIPMCYELRPAPSLMRTTAYMLREVADTRRQVSLADWFHFMWDRFRGIRKDITQQALCCAESIQLVEICARFHAHCAARLADLEHTQFDQRLNTDNLTKCLQTLKHMYGDVGPEMKPREAEFRGYIALLNLGDANFWWEIKQLPRDLQKSEAITFAMQIFNALDNNNYVRFFRLVSERATYLQACILLRYFNDVRARALARIVKAYAARGQSRYPAEELMNCLAFESIESMKSFVNHYGLRFAKDDTELTIILNRNQFIEDSDPYPIARAISLIESKRQSSVGEVIAGGVLPHWRSRDLYTSFTIDGKLKESALIAEDQGYNTINDSNKDVQALKSEIQRLGQGVRNHGNVTVESKTNLFVKSDTRSRSPAKVTNASATAVQMHSKTENKIFSFHPAIPVAPSDIIEISPQKVFAANNKNMFSFSKPTTTDSNNADNLFKATGTSLFSSKTNLDNSNLFAITSNNTTLFGKVNNDKNAFNQAVKDVRSSDASNKLFLGFNNKNIFESKDNTDGKNIFAKATKEIFPTKANNIENGGNIFATAVSDHDSDSNSKDASNIFGSFNRPNSLTDSKNLFAQQKSDQTKLFSAQNGNASSKLSPGSLFKSANNIGGKGFSIFQTKNRSFSAANNIFNSVQPENDIYEFNHSKNDTDKQMELQSLNEQKIREQEKKLKERLEKEEELRKQETKRQEDEKRKEEERKKQEEIKKLEEKRRQEEEKKQEELRKKLEEKRRAESKNKADKEKRIFEEKVHKVSVDLIEELVNEVRDETLKEILTLEIENMRSLKSFAEDLTAEIWIELCDEIACAEMKAEKFLTEKLMKKWFDMWKKQFVRNFKRRRLLEDTPVWLTDKTPAEEALNLRRSVEDAALKNMNAIHKGYKFNGELNLSPSPEPYNIMEIIKSSLLKRMRQINYPYDKCFFWKITIVSPGAMKWICRKVELEKWLIDAFGDNISHDTSASLIRVEKQTWNRLINFAISVSLANNNNKQCWSEAIEGSNGLLFYATEHDNHLIETITETLQHKYPYQIIPVVVVMPKMEDECVHTNIEQFLNQMVVKKSISCYKVIKLDSENILSGLNACTRSALKWIAKHYPVIPPLEIDHLKSVCQRYLGNEMWYRLKSVSDNRMNAILKDLGKLVKCYNVAIDKLTEAITHEDIFNYATFPLEFKEYLDHTMPYPKPYEFITANTKNSENTSAIKEMMKKLKLPNPTLPFQPISVVSLQDQIRKYCNQIAWFENPEQVVCKIVAVMPNKFSDLEMTRNEFNHYFDHYNLLDFLNIVVYEKINTLNSFDNIYAVYEKAALKNYCNANWLYEMDMLSTMKHKPLEYEDELDMYIESKRRKLELDSMEYLMLGDKDCTIVEKNVKATEESISRYSACEDAVKQLDKQIDLEKKKSVDLENLLRSALLNI